MKAFERSIWWILFLVQYSEQQNKREYESTGYYVMLWQHIFNMASCCIPDGDVIVIHSLLSRISHEKKIQAIWEDLRIQNGKYTALLYILKCITSHAVVDCR